MLIKRSCTIGSCLQKWSYRILYRDPPQLILQDPGTEILRNILQDPDTCGPKQMLQNPDTEILHNWPYRILIQRSCRGPTHLVLQDPDTEILHNWILIQRSWKSGHIGSCTEILQKWSHRILIQRSCTMITQNPDTEILQSWYRDLAEVVPWSYRILIQRSTQNPDTEILQKWSYRILIQRCCRSGHIGSCTECTISPTAFCYMFVQDPDTKMMQIPDTEILHIGSWHRDLAEVVAWSYRILIQIFHNSSYCTISCYTNLAQLVKQDPDTCGPTRSWYRDPHRILIRRSCTIGPTRS